MPARESVTGQIHPMFYRRDGNPERFEMPSEPQLPTDLMQEPRGLSTFRV